MIFFYVLMYSFIGTYSFLSAADNCSLQKHSTKNTDELITEVLEKKYNDDISLAKKQLQVFYDSNRYMPIDDKDIWDEGMALLTRLFPLSDGEDKNKILVDLESSKSINDLERLQRELLVRKALLSQDRSYVIQNARYTTSYTAQLWAFECLVDQTTLSLEQMLYCIEYFKMLFPDDQTRFYDRIVQKVIIPGFANKQCNPLCCDLCTFFMYNKKLFPDIEKKIVAAIWDQTANISGVIDILSSRLYGFYKPFIQSKIDLPCVVATKIVMMIRRTEYEPIHPLLKECKKSISLLVSYCVRLIQDKNWQKRVGNFFWHTLVNPGVVTTKDGLMVPILNDRTFAAITRDTTNKIDSTLRLALLSLKAQSLGVSIDTPYLHDKNFALNRIKYLEQVCGSIVVQDLSPALKEHHKTLHTKLLEAILPCGKYEENKAIIARNLNEGSDYSFMVLTRMQDKTFNYKTAHLEDFFKFVTTLVSSEDGSDNPIVSTETLFHIGRLYYYGIDDDIRFKFLKINKNLAYRYLKHAALLGHMSSWELCIPLAFEQKEYEDLYRCAQKISEYNPKNGLIELQRDLLRLKLLSDKREAYTQEEEIFLGNYVTAISTEEQQEGFPYVSIVKGHGLVSNKNRFMQQLSSIAFLFNGCLAIVNEKTFDAVPHVEIAITLRKSLVMWFLINRWSLINSLCKCDFKQYALVPSKVVEYCEYVIAATCNNDRHDSIPFNVDVVTTSLLMLLEQYRLGNYSNTQLIKQGFDHCLSCKDANKSEYISALYCWYKESVNETLDDEMLALLDFSISKSDEQSVLAYCISDYILYKHAKSSLYALLMYFERNSNNLKTIFTGPYLAYLDHMQLNVTNEGNKVCAKWQQIRESPLFKQLCMVAESKDDPVEAKRAARIVLRYEFSTAYTSSSPFSDIAKSAIEHVKKYSEKLIGYYTNVHDIQLKKEVEECLKLAMKNAVVASLLQSRVNNTSTDMYINIFNDIKGKQYQDAQKSIDSLKQKKVYSAQLYALQSSLVAHTTKNKDECVVHMKQAHLYCKQTMVSREDSVWMRYITQETKDFLWEEACKVLNDTNHFQIDYDLMACAVLINMREKTKEEQQRILNPGRLKNAQCSLLYARCLLNDDGVSIDEGQGRDWVVRKEIYDSLRYAIMQGQRSMNAAASIDSVTQREALYILEQLAVHDDLAAAVICAAYDTDADRLKHIARWPANIKLLTSCDHINEIMQLAEGLNIVYALGVKVDTKSLTAYLAYTRLFLPYFYNACMENNDKIIDKITSNESLFQASFAIINSTQCMEQHKVYIKKSMIEMLQVIMKKVPQKSISFGAWLGLYKL